MTTTKRTFGESIKAVREALGLSLSDFSRSIYYTPDNIRLMENEGNSHKNKDAQNRVALCIKQIYPQINIEFILGESQVLWYTDTVKGQLQRKEYSKKEADDLEYSESKDCKNIRLADIEFSAIKRAMKEVLEEIQVESSDAQYEEEIAYSEFLKKRKLEKLFSETTMP